MIFLSSMEVLTQNRQFFTCAAITIELKNNIFEINSSINPNRQFLSCATTAFTEGDVTSYRKLGPTLDACSSLDAHSLHTAV
jgi:hypothetical protein